MLTRSRCTFLVDEKGRLKFLYTHGGFPFTRDRLIALSPFVEMNGTATILVFAWILADQQSDRSLWVPIGVTPLLADSRRPQTESSGVAASSWACSRACPSRLRSEYEGIHQGLSPSLRAGFSGTQTSSKTPTTKNGSSDRTATLCPAVTATAPKITGPIVEEGLVRDRIEAEHLSSVAFGDDLRKETMWPRRGRKAST